ncbi:hypothetical protein ACFWHQ_29030 [Streptomyces sp. NPDC060334]|uniref:hypothetical protein n=1 Tax=unclassified Streptomyces TaxID=2593676 RepID=UPI0006AF9664|nr:MULTISPECIES: hypothetical protein [unclassified Streptomyces]MCX5073495.1 hypothetical protein [Streptomyces sp. NBC_00424]MCX5154956.1 hypothetical protein [Streptomyces sp. NBC_00291]WUD43255.1 hypothetical protein OHA84_23595 [Streptomyces sp. NBC_00513]
MTSFMTTTKMTDRSVAASCPLGVSSLVPILAAGVSTLSSGTPALLAASALRPSVRNERPTQAPVAVMAEEAQAHGAYGFAAAAAGAGVKTKQTKQQHHLMWAFRGLEPWSDPV